MMKINDEIIKENISKVGTIRYSIGGLSPLEKLMISVMIVYVIHIFPLAVPMIVGLYMAEFIAFRLTNQPRLTLIEIAINIASKYDINSNVNIVMSDKSSLYIKSNDDGNVVNIYLKESKSRYGLIILAETIQVYHLYVYLNLAKMACDNEYTHDDALNSTWINKFVSFFKTIKYIPQLYKSPVLEIKTREFP